MCRWVILALVLALLGLSSPVLFRRNAVQIKCNAKAVAIAKRPSALAWRGNKVDVCVGSSNMFSMLGDLWTFPVFIYSFPDAERFLCIYDDDTAVLAFVVDSDLSRTNALGAAEWPTNDYTRGILAQRATNVVVGTRCGVRLPRYTELQEASTYIAHMSSRQLKNASFPCADFGLYRFYWPREALLSALHTNRGSCWP